MTSFAQVYDRGGFDAWWPPRGSRPDRHQRPTGPASTACSCLVSRKSCHGRGVYIHMYIDSGVLVRAQPRPGATVNHDGGRRSLVNILFRWCFGSFSIWEFRQSLDFSREMAPKTSQKAPKGCGRARPIHTPQHLHTLTTAHTFSLPAFRKVQPAVCAPVPGATR